MITEHINRRYYQKRDMVWLEVTPPATVSKTPEATEQLFSVIHGMYATRKLRDKLMDRSPVFSFEITSTKKDGIRYLIQVERERSDALQKAVSAYIPDAKVKDIDAPDHSYSKVLEFKEQGHYVLPLTLTSAFAQHDPLSYVTSAMTKLGDDEQVTLQLVIAPIKLREAGKLSRKILRNEDVLSSLNSGPLDFLQKASDVMNKAMWGAVDLTNEVYHGTVSGDYYTQTASKQDTFKDQVTKRQRPARTLSAFELELMESMHKKVTQPHFQVSFRIMASGQNAKENIQSLRTALDGYSVPLYQSLRSKVRMPLLQQHRQKLAEKRLPNLYRRGSLILSAAEVAGLYHFPSSRISRTDNLITSLSRTLPAPVSLKSEQKLAVTIGENHHHGTTTAIGLTEAERERHLYIIGGTGNGKGVAVLDPHGDLAETVLRYVPEERINDVIYLNPDDLTYPIGMNLLELSDDLEGDDLLREKDLITESTISVMRKIFSEDDSGGHRIEYILRNAIQTALTLERPTLFTIFKLLNDAKYRREIVKTLDDENLKNFWKNELGKAGDFQKVKMAAGITAKIGRFLFSASARRVLEQEKSTIDFDKILDESKILICNFSKGLLGEDTSTLFGTTVLAKLQLASLRRARVDATNRRPFYLYVDEFQNFATMSFVQMLSESRKYKLFLTMAEQSTSQQDQQRLVDIILANVGTIICFRSGSPADERMVLPLFNPYIEQGEIANLPAYSFYARIAAVHSQEPMSGVTLLLTERGNESVARRVIDNSRQVYAREYKEAEAQKPTAEPTKQKESASKPKRQKRNKSQPTASSTFAGSDIKPVD